MNKPILCVDFDGVIHSYSSGWKGADVVSDPPVPGALKWLVEAMKHFQVAVYSSRSSQPGGITAMIQWLGYWSVDPEHGMPGDFDHGAWGSLDWPTQKPAAFLSIDDRAVCFDGDWSGLDPADLLKFKPWNKRERIEDPTDALYDAIFSTVARLAGQGEVRNMHVMSAAVHLLVNSGMAQRPDGDLLRLECASAVDDAIKDWLARRDAVEEAVADVRH